MLDTGIVLKVDSATYDALEEIAKTFNLTPGELLIKVAKKWMETPKFQRGLILNFILGRL